MAGSGGSEGLATVVDRLALGNSPADFDGDEGRNRQFIESVAVGTVELALDGCFLSANRAYCRITGYSLAELRRMAVHAITHPEDRERERQTLESFLSGRMPLYQTDKRYIRKDGRTVWVHVTAALVCDALGRPLRSASIVEDVTERKRGELALQESEAAHRAFFDNTAVGAAEIGLDGRLLKVNRCLCQITGYTARELARMTVAELTHPDDRLRDARGRTLYYAGRHHKYQVERRLVRKDGRIIWVNMAATLVRGEGGEPLRSIEIFSDITQHKLTEIALRDSEERFRTAFANTSIGLVMTAPDGRILDANPAYCRLSGFDLQEMRTGGPFSDHVHPEDQAAHQLLIGRLVAGKVREVVVEQRHLRADGRVIWVRKSVSTTGHASQGRKLVLWLIEDVTARREGEEALRVAKAEAERAVLSRAKFLAAASHDLRQPVQSLVFLLAALKQQASPAAVARATGLMENALEGLNGLLTSILDISRLDAGVMMPHVGPVELGAMVPRLALEYTALASRKGLSIKAVPTGLAVQTDPALLERLLRNLVENAIRYADKGGLLLGVRRAGQRVRIDVIDTGIGIPARALPYIFDEFYQVGNPGRDRKQGLGLGLSIVARLLGAELAVASTPGRGTRFSVLLPRVEAPAVLPTDPRMAEAMLPSRILVIEDEDAVRIGLALLLESWGHRVATAATGDEAVGAAEERGDFPFDLVIADHRLGRGLTGIDTARVLCRLAGRDLPVLVVTGDTAPERISEVHASGFAMMHKPVAAEELRKTVSLPCFPVGPLLTPPPSRDRWRAPHTDGVLRHRAASASTQECR